MGALVDTHPVRHDDDHTKPQHKDTTTPTARPSGLRLREWDVAHHESAIIGHLAQSDCGTQRTEQKQRVGASNDGQEVVPAVAMLEKGVHGLAGLSPTTADNVGELALQHNNSAV